MNQETKTCQNCKAELVIDLEDKKFLDRFEIPEPEICPRCVTKNLFSFFLFGKFRKTKSALSGKPIITAFSEDNKFPLYARDEWVSDAWNPMDFGMDYDPKKPFLEQIKELSQRVPHPHQSGVKNLNCDWANDVWESKNCYLTRSVYKGENLLYGYRIFECRDSADLVYCFNSEQSYDCLYCFNLSKVKYAFDSRNCLESSFLYDCRNVQNCFMCWNLRNKSYHILNRPYSKEEYFEKIKEFNTGSYSAIEKLKEQFRKRVAEEAIHKQNFNTKVVNSTGNFLDECRNCFDSFFLEKSENSRHIFRGLQVKDTIYSGGGGILEKCVYAAADAFMYETMMTFNSANCRYSSYLEICEECEYCFGCVGLRKKKFCILNKQYSEEKYNNLVEKIKSDMKQSGEWGKFFPEEMAYSGYNLSVAAQYFDEIKDSVIARGGRWEDLEDSFWEGISTSDLPDSIDESFSKITESQLICPKTKRKFNISPRELEFYKMHRIPLPRYHFDWRTNERFRIISRTESEKENCHFCGKGIVHYYPKSFGYKKIVCSECYKQKVN